MNRYIAAEFTSYTIRDGETLQVGRALDCDIRPLNDFSVSRLHCIFVNNSGTVTVADCGSTTGTTLNGAKLTSQPKTLCEGDVIQVGRARLIFHEHDDGSADETTHDLLKPDSP